MKTEIMNIAGKGMCIVISEIDINKLIFGGEKLVLAAGPFTNVLEIAHFIREGKKISAIKEIRYQTGWGLREAKEYIDRYMDSNYHERPDICSREAQRFMEDHTPNDWLNKDEFTV